MIGLKGNVSATACVNRIYCLNRGQLAVVDVPYDYTVGVFSGLERVRNTNSRSTAKASVEIICDDIEVKYIAILKHFLLLGSKRGAVHRIFLLGSIESTCGDAYILTVELILNTAKKNSIPQDEMPSKLYIISDMEFDCCAEDSELTNFEYAKKLYESAGYKLPQIVFWNVASRARQQPVTKNEQGVALVSGCTPRLFSMVASGELNPYVFMLEVVESERYAKIVA